MPLPGAVPMFYNLLWTITVALPTPPLPVLAPDQPLQLPSTQALDTTCPVQSWAGLGCISVLMFPAYSALCS